MAEQQSAKKGMTIYRAAESQELMESGFMTWPTMSDDARESLGETLAAGAQVGQHVRLLALQSPEDGGFSLVHVWFKANYPLPRHSHDSDCMYYVISGEAQMGNQVLKAGDSFFVPAEAPYVYTAGPEGVEVLEIRHNVAQFDMKIPDAPAARWQEMTEVSEANRGRWEAEQTSPTFAANQA
jgi:mannose-6-phosphate isomerase-like protein (cupin superfamily)